MQYRMNIRNTIYALSHALDLVGVDEPFHGKRVALIALEIAQSLDWSKEDLSDLFEASLLHDCGVSSTREHRHLVNELEWSNSQAHADRGYNYLLSVPELSHLALIVLYHHTRWNSLESKGADSRTGRISNLIFLADRLDVLQAGREREMVLRERGTILQTIEKYSGVLFNPEFVAPLRSIIDKEAFWFSLDPEIVSVRLDVMNLESDMKELPYDSIRMIAEMFARIIDAKSPHTNEHSLGVARIARSLGLLMGLTEDTLRQIEIAGLLHDLGKLRVPDEILDKPDELTAEERFKIVRHSFDTYHILKMVFQDSRIPEWASFHHEALSGEGYPFHRGAGQLCLEARIVAVADIYQALSQERPYRASLPHEEIMVILEGMVAGGKVDPRIVETIRLHPDEIWKASTGEDRVCA